MLISVMCRIVFIVGSSRQKTPFIKSRKRTQGKNYADVDLQKILPQYGTTGGLDPPAGQRLASGLDLSCFRL